MNSCWKLVEQVHELVVVHFVEKRLQIDVHHIPFALLDELLCRADRIVCAPHRAEAVAVFTEERFAPLAQLRVDGLLDQAVLHIGHAQCAFPAVRLRDRHRPHWAGVVFPAGVIAPKSTASISATITS